MSEFDCLIACESEEECNRIVGAIRNSSFFSSGYRVREHKRDWVNLAFTGADAGDGSLPPVYRGLANLLLASGFEQTWSYWGSRRFQKDQKRNDE
ncbi:hypothetical protein ESCO_001945 [Escovopsis weberi]|uniref:Uncharacterized protein n=1 Tax=Escovopsis weberi TaxID=150374 RepID=A0A0M8MZL6_ESCWE|nr:hypothetical protein ESCO_001945 [Escovopsis weberi]